MISYLHRRNLAVLPGDGTDGNDKSIKLNLSTLCANNTGTNGGIHASCQVGESAIFDEITYSLYRGDAPIGEVVERKTGKGMINEVEFTGLADDTYFVAATTAFSESGKSIVLSCFKAVVQPPETVDPNEILLEKIYANPTYEGTDPNDPRARGWIRYDVRVWKFNYTTEKAYLTQGTFRHAPLDEPPKDFIVGNPFYGYCKPASTIRRDFYYYHEGKVEVKEDPKSTACGFVAIRGCTNPAATNYNPNATEDDNSCYFRPQVLGCTDPNAENFNPLATDEDGSCTYAPEVKKPIFSVSIMNSLRFVAVENQDDCTTFQTLDNTLFCKEVFRGIRNVGYHQKVARCDQNIFQFRSNYDTASVNVWSEGAETLVDTIVPVVAVQNVGMSGVYASYLKNNTNSQTRVYFNTADIPMPVGVGDLIIITGHVDSDGTYAIMEIKQDVLAQTPYLVINRAYTASEAVTPASVQFQMANADYNVMEATVSWNNYPSGRYYLTIEATDDAMEPVLFVSEPVSLRESHPDTLLIEYRNYDNAFDMIYTTGIINRIRVEGELRKRLPSGEHMIHREPHNKLTRLVGIPYREVQLTTWKLPPYLHEKLAVVMTHDFIAINGVEYQCQEGYDKPDYSDQTALSNSGAIMEQTEWFKDHNDHDLGSINQQPLLIVNGGFLRL